MGLRFLGILALASAGVGAYVSGVIKDKMGGGGNGFKKAPQYKTEIITLGPDQDLVSAKIVVKERKKPVEE